MIYKTFDIALELKQTSTNPTFTVVEGDTGNRLRITVTDGGSPVDLTGCRVIAVFSKSNGLAVQDSAGENGGVEIGGTYNNVVTINIFSPSIAPGNVECELQIYSGEQSEVLITTARFNFKCNRAVMNGDALQSEEEFPLLVNLIKTVQGFVNDEELRKLAELERQAEYQKWANAEAVAETLPHGTPATAEVVEEGGKQVFKFGIPKGEQGETGPQGPQGEQGIQGANGTDGQTPVRGVDYWTAEDQSAVISEVLAALPTWNGGSY